jgi:LemA protein
MKCRFSCEKSISKDGIARKFIQEGITVSMIVILGVAVAVGVFFVSLYNGLVRSRNEVKNAWSSIDVQLKRRHDLIPNVVEAVKGYAAHERQTFDEVIKARQQAATSMGNVEDRAKVENALTRSLRSLFALAEQYPDLKASGNFIALQEELAATENKIGFARQYYNDAAMRYKNRVEIFPGNIVAGMYNFHAEPFFQLEEGGDRVVPQVKF